MKQKYDLKILSSKCVEGFYAYEADLLTDLSHTDLSKKRKKQIYEQMMELEYMYEDLETRKDSYNARVKDLDRLKKTMGELKSEYEKAKLRQKIDTKIDLLNKAYNEFMRRRKIYEELSNKVAPGINSEINESLKRTGYERVDKIGEKIGGYKHVNRVNRRKAMQPIEETPTVQNKGR